MQLQQLLMDLHWPYTYAAAETAYAFVLAHFV
jgi:hypothetical protein